MKRNDDKALDVLAQAIDSAVKEHIKSASFDRTTEGIITNILGNSKYEVLAFGSKYTVTVPQSMSFILNEKVRVVVPQNNWSAMFITKEDVVSSGGGSGGGHVIENYDGTVLPQRNILKFDGIEATDDPSGKTVVHGLGVKVVDSVTPPNIPVYAILKPIGTAPSIPLYIYPDGETIITDSNTGIMSVKSAPKLTSAVKIGNVDFDGSKNISLSEIGAYSAAKIRAGTVVRTTTASRSFMLFSNSQLNSLFGTTGVTYSFSNTVVLAMNGDFRAQSHTVTTAYISDDGGSFWVFTGDFSNFSAGNIRINYVVIKFA